MPAELGYLLEACAAGCADKGALVEVNELRHVSVTSAPLGLGDRARGGRELTHVDVAEDAVLEGKRFFAVWACEGTLVQVHGTAVLAKIACVGGQRQSRVLRGVGEDSARTLFAKALGANVALEALHSVVHGAAHGRSR